MQNKNHNIFYPKYEINLQDFLKYLINSKIIIIVITLICTSIATAYHFTRDPLYKSIAYLDMGHYSDIEVVKNTYKIKRLQVFSGKYLDNLKTEMNFYKNNDFNMRRHGNGEKFVEITTYAPSTKLAKNSIKEVIDYIIDKSNQTIAQAKANDKIMLESLSSQINFLEKQLDRMQKNIGNNEIKSNSSNYVFPYESELIIKLNELYAEKNSLSLVFFDLDNYKKSILSKEIKTIRVVTTPPLITLILLGSIAGFMLSVLIIILIIFFRQVWLQEPK